MRSDRMATAAGSALHAPPAFPQDLDCHCRPRREHGNTVEQPFSRAVGGESDQDDRWGDSGGEHPEASQPAVAGSQAAELAARDAAAESGRGQAEQARRRQGWRGRNRRPVELREGGVAPADNCSRGTTALRGKRLEFLGNRRGRHKSSGKCPEQDAGDHGCERSVTHGEDRGKQIVADLLDSRRGFRRRAAGFVNSGGFLRYFARSQPSQPYNPTASRPGLGPTAVSTRLVRDVY